MRKPNHKPEGSGQRPPPAPEPDFSDSPLKWVFFHIKEDWPVLIRNAPLGTLCVALAGIVGCWAVIWFGVITHKDAVIDAKVAIIERQDRDIEANRRQIDILKYEAGQMSPIQNLASNLFPTLATSEQLNQMYLLLASITNSLQLLIPSQVKSAIASDDQYPAVPHGVPVNELRLPIATIGELKQRVITGRTVFLASIPPAEVDVTINGRKERGLMIVSREFIGCDIFGPGVIGLTSTRHGNSVFAFNNFTDIGGNKDNLVMTMNGDVATGVVAMVDCSIVKCNLTNIGFVGDKAMIERLMKSLADE
jgi:hypothetical protein